MPLLSRLFMDDPSLSPGQRTRLNQITLGQAVAASCCVPGLFEPFSLTGLYTDKRGEDVEVRLVDGGVFDNQGLVSLFEEGCTHFVCSDASDLLQWQSRPVELIHQVAMRANDIMMDRIRNETLAELPEHGPDRYAIFTLGDDDGSAVFEEDKERFLDALRNIRTDLDAFTDLEARSLMYHGFMLSGFHLGDTSPVPAEPNEEEGDSGRWAFLSIEALAVDTEERARLLRYLDVGSRQFMKVFYLGKALPWVILIVPTLIPVGFSVLLIYLLPPIPTAAWVVLGLLVLTAVAFVQNARIIEWLDQIDWIRELRRKLAIALKPVGVTMMLAMIGALAGWINLRIFNPLFLHYGRLRGGRK
jgi:NTE family protein